MAIEEYNFKSGRAKVDLFMHKRRGVYSYGLIRSNSDKLTTEVIEFVRTLGHRVMIVITKRAT